MMPDQTLPEPNEDPLSAPQAAPSPIAGHPPRPEPAAGLRRAATRLLGRMRKQGSGRNARPAAGKSSGR